MCSYLSRKGVAICPVSVPLPCSLSTRSPSSDYDLLPPLYASLPLQRIEKERRHSVDAGIGTAPPPPSLPRCRALFSYNPTRPDELAMEVGDIIIIEKQNSDGWWSGVIKGRGGGADRRGMFPGNYGELL